MRSDDVPSNRQVPAEEFVEFTSGRGERWRVDLGALGSGWACGWGSTCRSIADVPDPTHTLGCCILGAELVDDEDAMNVAAHAALLEPERFQFAATAGAAGVFRDDDRRATRVVDGACIFLNRAGFAGGAGCALHLAALDHDEPPHEWKPLVCWQVPFLLERRVESGVEVRVVRRRKPIDFSASGEEADAVPWLCTGDPAFYAETTPVVERLRDELADWFGEDVVAEVERRLAD